MINRKKSVSRSKSTKKLGNSHASIKKMPLRNPRVQNPGSYSFEDPPRIRGNYDKFAVNHYNTESGPLQHSMDLSARNINVKSSQILK